MPCITSNLSSSGKSRRPQAAELSCLPPRTGMLCMIRSYLIETTAVATSTTDVQEAIAAMPQGSPRSLIRSYLTETTAAATSTTDVQEAIAALPQGTPRGLIRSYLLETTAAAATAMDAQEEGPDELSCGVAYLLLVLSAIAHVMWCCAWGDDEDSDDEECTSTMYT
jgi:hypothetical protein